MPLVGFRPTKARLIIDDSNDTVLVMKVVVADSESVELASGGKLDALTGVLRIRERKEGEGRNGAVGSLVYIEDQYLTPYPGFGPFQDALDTVGTQTTSPNVTVFFGKTADSSRPTINWISCCRSTSDINRVSMVRPSRSTVTRSAITGNSSNRCEM